MRRHPRPGRIVAAGFLRTVAAPFVMFALKDFLSRPFLEWGFAVALSFVGWLFVRRH